MGTDNIIFKLAMRFVKEYDCMNAMKDYVSKLTKCNIIMENHITKTFQIYNYRTFIYDMLMPHYDRCKTVDERVKLNDVFNKWQEFMYRNFTSFYVKKFNQLIYNNNYQECFKILFLQGVNEESYFRNRHPSDFLKYTFFDNYPTKLYKMYPEYAEKTLIVTNYWDDLYKETTNEILQNINGAYKKL